MDDAELPGRAAWGAALKDIEGGPCPSDDRLVALVMGEAQGDERARLADHVGGCSRCAASWRELRALHEELGAQGLRPEGGMAEPGRADRPPRRAMPRRGLWVGVAALAAAGLAVVLLRPGAPRADRLRGGEAPVAGPVEPAAEAQLGAAPARLAWPADALPGAPGGEARIVSLFDGAGALLWQSPPVVASSVILPPEVGEALGPGAYQWTVRPTDPNAPAAGPWWFTLGDAHGPRPGER